MEAMTMGSPVGSPLSSPGMHGNQSAYIPGYLLGDHTPSASPGSHMWTASPGVAAQKSLSRSMHFSAHSPHTNPAQVSFITSPRMEPKPRDLIGSRTKEKSTAPPVMSLIDSISATPDKKHDSDGSLLGSRLSQTGTPLAPHTPRMLATHVAHGTPVQESSFYAQARKTPPSPAQVDPFYTQGEYLGPDDQLDETWVTIFGFPPAATSFILQQFSQYGNILKHIIAPDGNWMHLHYQSKLQAKKALSKNGKVFGNSIMVGVSPCIDKNVMADVQEVSNLHHSSYLDASYSRQVTPAGSKTSDRLTPIRPLTAAYKAASSDHEVLNATNTPQKSSGIVSKAMEYMFGW